MENPNKFKKYVPGQIPLEEYPTLKNDTFTFLDEEFIAYAVCGKDCGHKEFIVDGQTQICPCCGRHMFRTEVKKYVLVEEKTIDNIIFKWRDNRCTGNKPEIYEPEDIEIEDYQDVDFVEFPNEINLSLAICGNDCGYGEFIVDGSTQICQHCGRLMIKTGCKKYVLAED